MPEYMHNQRAEEQEEIVVVVAFRTVEHLIKR
jgi:hypothetical protein